MPTLRVLFLLTLFLAGCALRDEAAVTACTEPRPTVCTGEYYPVCGEWGSGERQTYSSPCNACAHDRVVAYAPEACPDQP
jgi:hypothetical protein